MPTIEQNKNFWDEIYPWSKGGDEWSVHWGGSNLKWWVTVFPRIQRFVPTDTILEIAPGFGRWTQYLKDLCNHLIIVDLSEKCIQACKERFSNYSHISYHVNDGKSLDIIPDHSIDFVFSFDSLVHVEDDVLEAYLSQLGHKFKPGGVGFMHHSNRGEDKVYISLLSMIPMGIRAYLMKKRILDRGHGRALSVTAKKFQEFADKAGMQCISQEIMSWWSRRMIDCFSVFTPKGSVWTRPNKIIRNNDFVKEANYALRLAEVYHGADLHQKIKIISS